MATNTELEERWIDAWNDLFDIVGERWNVNCLLPDGSIVDVETCKGWLQNSAYEDYCLNVDEIWIKHEKGIVVSRFKEGNRPTIPE
jgi:hypothetical protein